MPFARGGFFLHFHDFSFIANLSVLSPYQIRSRSNKILDLPTESSWQIHLSWGALCHPHLHYTMVLFRAIFRSLKELPITSPSPSSFLFRFSLPSAYPSSLPGLFTPRPKGLSPPKHCSFSINSQPMGSNSVRLPLPSTKRRKNFNFPSITDIPGAFDSLGWGCG